MFVRNLRAEGREYRNSPLVPKQRGPQHQRQRDTLREALSKLVAHHMLPDPGEPLPLGYCWLAIVAGGLEDEDAEAAVGAWCWGQ